MSTDAHNSSVLNTLRIGYTSFSRDHRHPGDRRRFPHFARAYGIPLIEAKPSGDYDIVVVTQAADISAWTRLPRGGARIVYDLPDAHLSVGFLNSPREVARGIGKFVVGQNSSLVLDFRKAMADMCRRADAVVCSSPEHVNVLAKYNRRVLSILDFSMVAATGRKTTYAAADPLRIVWEGHGGNAGTLGVIVEPLRALARERRLEVHLITDIEYPAMLRHYGRRSALPVVRRALPDIPTFFHEWNEGMIGVVAPACDIAVIPLPSSNRLYWNKPENRLLLQWRLGMPTVVTATPAHVRAMRAAGQDNYCRTDSEWTERLRILAGDETARRSAGEGGREWVERTWSEERLLELWELALRRALTADGAQATAADNGRNK